MDSYERLFPIIEAPSFFNYGYGSGGGGGGGGGGVNVLKFINRRVIRYVWLNWNAQGDVICKLNKQVCT